MASPQAQGPNVNRSRAGYLGSLTKLYKYVDEIVSSNAQLRMQSIFSIASMLGMNDTSKATTYVWRLTPKATPSFKFRMIWHNKSTTKFVFYSKPTSLVVLSQRPHQFAVSSQVEQVQGNVLQSLLHLKALAQLQVKFQVFGSRS